MANTANKRETENYTLSDYLLSIRRHCQDIQFDYIVLNSNQKPLMKPKDQYTYLPLKFINNIKSGKIIMKDIVDEKFPVQHDSLKLGKVLHQEILKKTS